MNNRGRNWAKQNFFASSRARANELAKRKKELKAFGQNVPDPEKVENQDEVKVASPGEVLPDPKVVEDNSTE